MSNHNTHAEALQVGDIVSDGWWGTYRVVSVQSGQGPNRQAARGECIESTRRKAGGQIMAEIGRTYDLLGRYTRIE
jgi:hypothetical protein